VDALRAPGERRPTRTCLRGVHVRNESTDLLVTASGEPDPIGFVSLFDIDEASGRAELALWIAPAEQGNGYATAAGRAVLAYAFEERRFNRVTAGALGTNAASRRALEKLGFEREGTLREFFYVGGEYVDRIVSGLLAQEFEE
jgi:RimJ/RimL family protein N-acetyltransferase